MPSRYLTKNANQTIVYWASPVPDGWGGSTFDDPVELTGRWEKRQELFIDEQGQEVRSNAVISQLSQDVDMGGWLYLGSLDDLSSAEEDSPETISTARKIRGFAKIPNIKADAYYRKAWV